MIYFVRSSFYKLHQIEFLISRSSSSSDPRNQYRCRFFFIVIISNIFEKAFSKKHPQPPLPPSPPSPLHPPQLPCILAPLGRLNRLDRLCRLGRPSRLSRPGRLSMLCRLRKLSMLGKFVSQAIIQTLASRLQPLHCSKEQVYNSKPIAEENSAKSVLSPVIRAAQTLNPNGLNNGDRLGQKPEP